MILPDALFIFKKHPPGTHPQVQFFFLKKNSEGRKCSKDNRSVTTVATVAPQAVMPKAKRASRPSTGGAHNCCECNQICSYGHKCPACKKYFHDKCLLSMNDGEGKSCIKCFEKSGGGDLNQLDSHDHTPYSPDNFVPYHPYTKRYHTQRGLFANESDESNYSDFLFERDDDDESDSNKASGKTKKKDGSAGKTTKKAGSAGKTKKKSGSAGKTKKKSGSARKRRRAEPTKKVVGTPAKVSRGMTETGTPPAKVSRGMLRVSANSPPTFHEVFCQVYDRSLVC